MRVTKKTETVIWMNVYGGKLFPRNRVRFNF